MSSLRNICTLLVLLCLMASCSYYGEERDNLRLLNRAADVLNSDTEGCLSYLKQVNTSLLSEQENAYYILLQARANDLTGANIAPLETAVSEAKQLILRDYQPERAAFACFVMGKVQYAQGNLPMAMYNFMQADDWAEKTGYNLASMPYSQIPYNIAALLYDDKEYEKSLSYLSKALQQIYNSQYIYLEELFALELKGLDFKNLGILDSTLFYYDKALSIANKNNDLTSRNRILHNKISVLYYSEEYLQAEKKCMELLPQCLESRDTLHAGLTYMILAEVYQKTGRLDSALVFANNAKSMLSNSESWATSALLETLITIESKKGNTSKASAYQQQLNRLKEEVATKRRVQDTEVAIAIERAKQQGIAAQQALQVAESHRGHYKELLRFTRMAVAASALLLVAFGVAVYLKRKKRLKAEHEQCREEMLLYLAQQRKVKSLIREVEEFDSERKESLSETLTNLQIMLKMSPQLDRSYGNLYYKLRSYYPDLTPDELYILWLAKTRTLQLTEIREYLSYPAFEFNRIRLSMIQKVRQRSWYQRMCSYITQQFSHRNDDDNDVPLSK